MPGGCAAGSVQEQWLRADLQNAATNNVIAIWHKPRWSSGGSSSHMQALWQALYDFGVDATVVGHVHDYERFAPMNASGVADRARRSRVRRRHRRRRAPGFGTILADQRGRTRPRPA